MEATGKRAEAHSLIWRTIYRKIDSSPSPEGEGMKSKAQTNAANINRLFVRTRFHYLSLIHHDDLVGVSYRGEPVRHHFKS